MIFGVAIPNFGHLADPENVARMAMEAEQLGYSCVWAAERLLVPIPPNQGWSRRNPAAYEPLVTLSYIAGKTAEIHLGTAVIILPVRNPVLLARQAASLDRLSGGRLELGMGIGWMREEMEVSGVAFEERGMIADEYISAMRNIWMGKAYEGRYLHVPENLFEPKPVRGNIPIWIGGNSEAALRRAAKLGDGWVPMGYIEPERMERVISRLEKTASRSGRGGIRVACSLSVGENLIEELDSYVAKIDDYERAGVYEVIPHFEAEGIKGRLRLMKVFAEDLMPSFGGKAPSP